MDDRCGDVENLHNAPRVLPLERSCEHGGRTSRWDRDNEERMKKGCSKLHASGVLRASPTILLLFLGL